MSLVGGSTHGFGYRRLLVGERVELVRRIPIATESIIPLGPGDVGVLQVIGVTDCVVSFSGLSVRVPKASLVPAGTAY